jgi:hypothetical protein
MADSEYFWGKFVFIPDKMLVLDFPGAIISAFCPNRLVWRRGYVVEITGSGKI